NGTAREGDAVEPGGGKVRHPQPGVAELVAAEDRLAQPGTVKVAMLHPAIRPAAVACLDTAEPDVPEPDGFKRGSNKICPGEIRKRDLAGLKGATGQVGACKDHIAHSRRGAELLRQTCQKL